MVPSCLSDPLILSQATWSRLPPSGLCGEQILLLIINDNVTHCPVASIRAGFAEEAAWLSLGSQCGLEWGPQDRLGGDRQGWGEVRKETVGLAAESLSLRQGLECYPGAL